jgi:hypothetical protein
MRKEELVQALLRLDKPEAVKPAHRTVAAAHTNGHAHGANGVAASSSNGKAHATNGKAAANGKVSANGNGKPASNGALKIPSNGVAKVSANGNGKAATNGKVPLPHGKPASSDRGRSLPCAERLDSPRLKSGLNKDLANDGSDGKGYTRDRLVALVRGPYWLHAYWEVTRQSVERARVALAQHWHAAKPVLRLCEVTRDGTTNTARSVIRDIEIHGGVNNWYVDVVDPPKSYQLDIGYIAAEGRFLSLARSNMVTTPAVGAGEAMDGGWGEVAKDHDRIYALSGGYALEGNNRELKDLFEERLHRSMGTPLTARLGICGAVGVHRDFPFQVDAELVVYGVTEPGSHVTLRGEPVRLGPDGTFSVRFSLPDRRHVLPVVASSPDGAEQRTIVLAVERNTKIMEPAPRDPEA